ncbi:MAG: thiamine phosphate synthase [Arcobacteraceae bacterium]
MTKKQKKEALYKPPFFISYLITDPEEFGNTPESLKSSLSNALKLHNVDIICFRDKVSSDKEKLVEAFLEVCREFSIQTVLINSDIELSEKLGFDGVHLNSQQFDKIQSLQNKNIFTIISCHNENEIQLAKKNGANMITYSPIFF